MPRKIRIAAKRNTTGNQPLGTADAKHNGNLPKSAAGRAILPIVATVETVETPTVAKPSRDVSRTAHTVAMLRTNFGGTLSDRDNAYIAFFAGFAKRDTAVTLAAIRESKLTPAYAGSAKPYDAGVIVRLQKAGVLAVATDGSSFTFTPIGAALKAYTSAKALS